MRGQEIVKGAFCNLVDGARGNLQNDAGRKCRKRLREKRGKKKEGESGEREGKDKQAISQGVTNAFFLDKARENSQKLKSFQCGEKGAKDQTTHSLTQKRGGRGKIKRLQPVGGPAREPINESKKRGRKLHEIQRGRQLENDQSSLEVEKKRR